MALYKLVRRNCDGKWLVSIKYENLHSFKEGVILSCQSIPETRRISYLHGSALYTIPLKETHNSFKIRCLEFEKKWKLHSTCDYLRYVTLLICLPWSVVWFWGVIRKGFLAWISFTAHNKGIATKSAENMSREQFAGQLFCKTNSSCMIVFDVYIILLSGIG